MGFFDLIFVCPECKTGVPVSLTGPGTCPDCGTRVIRFGDTSPEASRYRMGPKFWNKMSPDEKKDFIERALSASPLEQTQQEQPEVEEAWPYEQYITTTQSFVNGDIEQQFGVVSGTHIYLVGGAFGGGMASQEKLIDNAMLKAKKHMYVKARALGANAIIGASFSIASPGDLNNIILMATGTAVKVNF